MKIAILVKVKEILTILKEKHKNPTENNYSIIATTSNITVSPSVW